MYGSGVTCIDKTRIEQLERVQNDMARFITGASKGAALEGLRGELGWWRMRDQMALGCFRYARRHEFIGETEWARGVHGETRTVPVSRRSLLQRRVEKWAVEYGVNLQQPVQTRGEWKRYIKGQVEQKVLKEWREGRDGKSTLQGYRGKTQLGMEGYWDGTRGATLIFKARIGDLRLGKRDYSGKGSEECQMCREGVGEDVPHFLLECPAYRGEREEWDPGGRGWEGRTGHHGH
jgi:hypothetical protein